MSDSAGVNLSKHVEILNKAFNENFIVVNAAEEPVKLRETFTRSIFIGMGGTGQKVIKRLKAKMDRYGLRKLPIFGFLVFDTAGIEPATDQEKELQIDRSEFVSLQVPGALAYIAEAEKAKAGQPSTHPELGEWLPDGFSASAIMAGAGARRSVGRFAFFVNAEKAGTAMYSLVTKVRDYSRDRELKEKGLALNVDSQTHVYIVGSICGGTGSGIFLDLAYVFRSMLADKDPALVKIIGMLLTNFPNATPEHRANEYAALMELNYFSREDTVFRAKYKGVIGDVYRTERPFDITYLIGNQTSSGDYLNHIDNVAELMAEFLFLQTCTDTGKKVMIDQTDNIEAWFREENGRPRCFSGFGISSTQIPWDWIVERWGSKLAATILDKLLSRGGAASGDAAELAAGILSKYGATERIDDFEPYKASRSGMNLYIQNTVRPAAVDRSDSLDSAKAKLSMRRLTVDNSLEGQLQQNGLDRATEKLAEFSSELDRTVMSIYANPSKGGYAAADAFLQTVMERLETLRKSIRAKIELMNKQARRYDDELNGVEAEMSRSRGIFAKRPHPDKYSGRYLEVLEAKVRNQWELDTLRHIDRSLEELIGRISGTRQNVKSALRTMNEVLQRFQQHYAASGEIPSGLPFYSESPLEAADIDMLYNEGIEDAEREKERFLAALSSLSDFVQMTEDRIFEVMRVYVTGRLSKVFSMSIVDLLKRKYGAEPASIATVVRRIHERAQPAWNYVSAAMSGEVKQLDIMIGRDNEDELLKRSYYQEILDSTSRDFVKTEAIPDKVWVMRTAHGIGVHALSDIDAAFRDFKMRISGPEGAKYLFTDRRYLEELGRTPLKEEHAIPRFKAKETWVKAIAFGVIVRSEHDRQYTFNSKAYGQVVAVPLGQGRKDAYTRFESDGLLLERVMAEVAVAEKSLSVSEIAAKLEAALGEVTNLRYTAEANGAGRAVLELLESEAKELSKLLARYRSAV